MDEESGKITVLKPPRDTRMVSQITRQLKLLGGDGTKLRWEVGNSAEDAAVMQAYFSSQPRIQGIDKMTVVFVAQKGRIK